MACTFTALAESGRGEFKRAFDALKQTVPPIKSNTHVWYAITQRTLWAANRRAVAHDRRNHPALLAVGVSRCRKNQQPD